MVKSQLDSHCWKYYIVKFVCDYTLPNRRRLENAKFIYGNTT